jgi:hypothetical protein
VKRSLALSLATIKKLFDQGCGPKNGLQFDRQKMVVLTDALKETEARVTRIRFNPKKPGCGQSLSTDFGEFCVLVHQLVAQKAADLPGIRPAFDGLAKRSGLDKWMERRMPCADEVRGRWEVMMLQRHIQTFFQNMMGNELKVTPRQDDVAQPPYFNADKIPKRMTKHRTVEANWKLLEDREDAPGIMKDLQNDSKDSKKDSKGLPRQSKLGAATLAQTRQPEGSSKQSSTPVRGSIAVGQRPTKAKK